MSRGNSQRNPTANRGRNPDKESPWERDYGNYIGNSPLINGASQGINRYEINQTTRGKAAGKGDVKDSVNSQSQKNRRSSLGSRIFAASPNDSTCYGSTNAYSEHDAKNSNLNSERTKIRNGYNTTKNVPSIDQKNASFNSLKYSGFHAPQTELQMLTARNVWIMLLLPAMMTLLVLAIPTQYSLQMDTIDLSQSSVLKPKGGQLNVLEINRVDGRLLDDREFNLLHLDMPMKQTNQTNDEDLLSPKVLLSVNDCSTKHIFCERYAVGRISYSSSFLPLSDTSELIGMLHENAYEEKGIHVHSVTEHIALHPKRTVNALNFLDVSLRHKSGRDKKVRQDAHLSHFGSTKANSNMSLEKSNTKSEVNYGTSNVSPTLGDVAQLHANVQSVIISTPSLLSLAQNYNNIKKTEMRNLVEELQPLHEIESSTNIVPNAYAKFISGFKTGDIGVLGPDMPDWLDRLIADGYNSSQPFDQSNELVVPLLYTSFNPPNVHYIDSSKDERKKKETNGYAGYSHWFQTLITLDFRSISKFDENEEENFSPPLSRTNDVSANSYLLSSLLNSSELVVISQSTFYIIFDILLRLSLSLGTSYMLVLWWKRSWLVMYPAGQVAVDILKSKYDRARVRVGTDSIESGINADIDINILDKWFGYVKLQWMLARARFRIMMSVLLPEQLTSSWMLLFLWLWQSPMQAGISLASLFEIDLGGTWLTLAECSRSMSKYGLLFCALIYIDGLKYFPGIMFFDDDELEQGDTQIQSSFSSLFPKKGGERNISLPSYVRLTTPSPSRRDKFPLLSQMSSLPSDLDTQYDEDQEELTDIDGQPLPAHHILGKDFIDFILPKALILIFSWLCSYAFWTVNVGESKAQVSYWDYYFLVMGVLSSSLMVVWILLLISAARSTNRRLKNMSYSLSRFRQLAFRLFLSQFYIWTTVLLIVGVYRWQECSHILSQQLGFFGTSSYLLFVKPFTASSEELARMQLEVLIYLSSDYSPPFAFIKSISLVSLSAFCYTIAYSLTPPSTNNLNSGKNEVTDNTELVESSINDAAEIQKHMEHSSNYDKKEDYGSPAQSTKYDSSKIETFEVPLRTCNQEFVGLERHLTPLYQLSPDKKSSHNQSISYILTTSTHFEEVNGSSREGYPFNSRSQQFCLETACNLLEVSYQSYFRPTGKLTAIPDSFNYLRVEDNDADEKEEKNTPGSKSCNGFSTGNPFDSSDDECSESEMIHPKLDDDANIEKNNDSDSEIAKSSMHDQDCVNVKDVREALWEQGPAMDLRRCDLTLVGTFFDRTYANMGFVSQTYTAPKTMATKSAMVGTSSSLTPPLDSKSDCGVAFNEPEYCMEDIAKRIVVCYRGTIQYDNLVTDLRIGQSPVPDFQWGNSIRRYKEMIEFEQFRRRVKTDTTTVEKEHGEYDDDNKLDKPKEYHKPDTASTFEDDNSKKEIVSGCDDEGSNIQKYAISPMKSLVSALPVIQQTLPLLHIGFKEAYLAIRNQANSSLVYSIFKARKERREAVRSSSYLREELLRNHSKLQTRGSLASASIGKDKNKTITLPPLEIMCCGHSLGAGM